MGRFDPAKALRGVDLNLLPVLGALLEEHNVTRSAARLNMTQSAVSEALKRLRAQFEDPLLVKVGRRMIPTSYADSLSPHIRNMLEELDHLLEPPIFDPSREKREFLVATGDNVVLALGSELIDRLSRKAPHVTIQFINTQYVTQEDLEKGDIDLFIIPRDLIPRRIFDDTNLESMHIFREEWICISRKDHPRLRNGLTSELMEELPAITLRLDENSHLYALLPGRQAAEQLHVTQFTLLPFLVAQTDAIATLQRHIAVEFARFLPLDMWPLPISFPALDLSAYWAPIHKPDRMHAWLRNELKDIVANSQNRWLPRRK